MEKMTRSRYFELLHRKYEGLNKGQIFFYNGLEEGVLCREIYSSSKTEVVIWLETETAFYARAQFPFKAILNDSVFTNGGRTPVTTYLEEDIDCTEDSTKTKSVVNEEE